MNRKVIAMSNINRIELDNWVALTWLKRRSMNIMCCIAIIVTKYKLNRLNLMNIKHNAGVFLYQHKPTPWVMAYCV